MKWVDRIDAYWTGLGVVVSLAALAYAGSAIADIHAPDWLVTLFQ